MNNIASLEHYLKERISEEKIKSILDTAAEQVKNDIQNLAPVDTGAYRNSIVKSNVKKEGNNYSISIYSQLPSGWKGVALGYLLEWGTGIKGEQTNNYDHGYPYRQTPWVYFNDRYGRWVFTHGNIARPHFYPGLMLNKKYFRELVSKEIGK